MRLEFSNNIEELERIEKLKNKKVIVFGVGGVGSYVCEALVRTGVGTITVVDNDTINTYLK